MSLTREYQDRIFNACGKDNLLADKIIGIGAQMFQQAKEDAVRKGVIGKTYLEYVETRFREKMVDFATNEQIEFFIDVFIRGLGRQQDEVSR